MKLNIVPHDEDISPDSILQIRHIIKRLELPPEYNAESAIFTETKVFYATETPEDVANAVNLERSKSGLKNLSQLTLPGGKTVWFAGERASGPIKLLPEELMDGIHSAFSIERLTTRVRNSPDEVRYVISNAKEAGVAV